MVVAPPVAESAELDGLRTPALVIDLDAVDANIAATLRLLDGNPDRWRPHLKTSKLLLTMRRIHAAGVRQAKCATTLELETACEAGFEDVLLAYPVVGPAVEEVKEIDRRYPQAWISVLVESPEMVVPWVGSDIGVFIDINPGMDRTGLEPGPSGPVVALAKSIRDANLQFGGLHFYDGHAGSFEPSRARALVHDGYQRLLGLVRALEAAGVEVPELITAGTPAFPHAAGSSLLREAGLLHRMSPGTVVYNDCRSLTQLPADAGYQPAAWVASRVVSHPGPMRFTCDAGHKTVSADAGVPTCAIAGHPDWTPRHPSEEHLPVDVPPGTPIPDRGSLLWLCPSHVCPTVNNFDRAVITSGNRIRGVERVTARGRAAPL